MGRDKGLLPFAGNFEPEKAGAFDARANIPTKADLIVASNWTAGDGNSYVYEGMTVTVAQDTTAANNGIYVLVDPSNITAADYSGWIFIGA
ncbi:MAG: hypothetical protein GY936_17800, partial [Ignavibacteriae bacterium]|nr:hypothetical protein [Ignavibacteriota bacterium]